MPPLGIIRNPRHNWPRMQIFVFYFGKWYSAKVSYLVWVWVCITVREIQLSHQLQDGGVGFEI